MGFFPFERRRLSLGVPVSGWLSPCQGLIHAPGVQWDSRELLRGCRLSAWKFDNLVADQLPFRPYHAAMALSPMIDLTDGFDTYYAKLRVKSPRFCRELARRSRKLAREAGELHMVADSGDIDVLRTLMAWKSEQYRRTSHVDRFEEPWFAALLEALHATRGGHVSGLLSVLYAGDEPVAAQFGLRTGNLLVGWFTAHNPRFRKYSPGLIHLKQLAKELSATGIQAIDMGGGAKNYYKETLKTHDIFVAQGIVTGRSVLGTAHRAHNASIRWAARTVHQRPNLYRAADQVLRRSGLSRRIYGRFLGFAVALKYLATSDAHPVQPRPARREAGRPGRPPCTHPRAHWHLGVDDEASGHTKARYKFPFGDFGKVHRCGVLATEVRAGRNKYRDIEDAAIQLRDLMDKRHD